MTDETETAIDRLKGLPQNAQETLEPRPNEYLNKLDYLRDTIDRSYQIKVANLISSIRKKSSAGAANDGKVRSSIFPPLRLCHFNPPSQMPANEFEQLTWFSFNRHRYEVKLIRPELGALVDG